MEFLHLWSHRRFFHYEFEMNFSKLFWRLTQDNGNLYRSQRHQWRTIVVFTNSCSQKTRIYIVQHDAMYDAFIKKAIYLKSEMNFPQIFPFQYIKNVLINFLFVWLMQNHVQGVAVVFFLLQTLQVLHNSSISHPMNSLICIKDHFL